MQQSNGWKATAIIFIILLILENVIFTWAYLSMAKEEEKISICYYEVCKDYPDAEYNPDLKVCTCYDKDELGNPIVADQIYMGSKD